MILVKHTFRGEQVRWFELGRHSYPEIQIELRQLCFYRLLVEVLTKVLKSKSLVLACGNFRSYI